MYTTGWALYQSDFPLGEVFLAARRKKVGATGGSRLSSGETGNLSNVTGRSFRATGKAVQKDKPGVQHDYGGQDRSEGKGSRRAERGWIWVGMGCPTIPFSRLVFLAIPPHGRRFSPVRPALWKPRRAGFERSGKACGRFASGGPA